MGNLGDLTFSRGDVMRELKQERRQRREQRLDRRARDLKQRVADLERRAATGWRVLYAQIPIQNGDELEIEPGVFDKIRLHMRGGTSHESRIELKINHPELDINHAYVYTAWRLDTGEVVRTNDGSNHHAWVVAHWGDASRNTSECTISGTRGGELMTLLGRSYRAAAGTSLRHYTVYAGHITSNRVPLSRLHFDASVGAELDAVVWVEGLVTSPAQRRIPDEHGDDDDTA